MRAFDAEDLVTDEYHRITAEEEKLRSVEQSIGLLYKHLDGLWQALLSSDSERIRAQVVQIGAMALRILVDLCESPFDEVKKGGTVVSITK